MNASPHYAALQRATSVLFIAHGAQLALALLALGPLVDVAHERDLVALLSLAFTHGPARGPFALWALVAYAIVGPLLTQALLTRLAHPVGLRVAFARATGRLGRAMWLSALRWLGVLLALALAWLGDPLAQAVPPLLEQTARWTMVGTAAVIAASVSAAHDLAATRLALAGSALLRSPARTHLLRLTPAWLLYAAGSALFYIAAEWIARATDTASVALAVSQLGVLGAATLRAAWLEHLVASPDLHHPICVTRPEPGSRATRAA